MARPLDVVPGQSLSISFEFEDADLELFEVDGRVPQIRDIFPRQALSVISAPLPDSIAIKALVRSTGGHPRVRLVLTQDEPRLDHSIEGGSGRAYIQYHIPLDGRGEWNWTVIADDGSAWTEPSQQPRPAPPSTAAPAAGGGGLAGIGAPLAAKPSPRRPTPLGVNLLPGQVKKAARSATNFAVTSLVENLSASIVKSAGVAAFSRPPETHAGDSRQVWFATNRMIDRSKPYLAFANARGDQTHFGYCDVFVPEWHKRGSLGSSFIRRLVTMRDDRLSITGRIGLDSAEYWDCLREVVASRAPGEKRPTVFLHGYNVSFDAAALRAAQLAADLDVPGPMCFFSWPSRNHWYRYAADAASIEASEQDIADFLTRLAADTGAERVDVIAHSMGNRGLLRAVNSILARAHDASGAKFGHFVLAAPDVDRAVFERLAAAYSKVAQRTTLYVSNRDKALWASRLLYMYGRAGFAPPVTVLDGIDTIHVANSDLSILAHGYVASARDVLTDMHQLLEFDAEPGRRAGLREVAAPGGSHYWMITD